ncbi:MAG: hypothetical protein AAF434_11905 [Pseudomonadota bacterium]
MSNFTDLRLNHVGGQPDESFWPSFTDIMMVVVMIFLITSATLILRNTELIRQVTESEEAKELAAAMAEDEHAQNVTLEEQLEAVRHQLSMARLQQLKTMEEKFALEKQLTTAQEKLDALELSRKEIDAMLEQTKSQSNSLDERVKQLQAQLSQSEQLRGTAAEDLESTLAQLELTNESLNSLQEQYNLSRQELTELIERMAASDTLIAQLQTEKSAQLETVQLSEEQLAELRAEYLDLKSKYDKLVRPARTTKGKYVVSVRYLRIGEQRIIDIKQPQDATFSSIDRDTLDATLSALKERHTDKLYIKVIIPDDSNLSYNEAWGFTRDLLSKYDYYHQGDQSALPLEE